VLVAVADVIHLLPPSLPLLVLARLELWRSDQIRGKAVHKDDSGPRTSTDEGGELTRKVKARRHTTLGVIVLKRILHMGHVFAVFDQCIIQLPRVKGGIQKKKKAMQWLTVTYSKQ
jgi:hypothetical protein